MELRLITPADLQACAEVFYTADDDLTARNGLPPAPRNPVALLRLFGLIVQTDPQLVWLARDAGRVVAFGMACRRGELTFLSFLFVLPDAQGRGLGRELLERCMAGSRRRAVSIFSVQPISAGLYARYGMVPRVPMYTFMGSPRSPLPALPLGLRLGALDASARDELDREITGFSRAADHDAWMSWDRRPHALFEGEQLVGYAYAQPSGRLAPVVVRRRELLLPFIGQLMRDIEPLDAWMLNVPGPAAETFEALLSAGFRLDGPPVIYCATDLVSDHSRYLPGSFALP